MKNLLRFLFVLSLASSTNTLQAQKFSLAWSDNTKLKYDFDDAVQLDNGNFIVLKSTYGTGMLGKAKPARLSLILVSKSMEEIKESPLEIDAERFIPMGFQKFGKNIFFLYQLYDKEVKQTSVNALRINEKSLGTDAQIALGSFESDNSRDQAEPSIKISEDSSKVLLFVAPPFRKKENEKFFLGVFDNNLKNLWKREVELDVNQKFVGVYDQDLTNDGKVYVAAKFYDKEVTRESVKEDGEKVPSYTYKMLVYESAKSKIKDIVFNLDNNYVQGTKLTYNKRGSITVAGLYKTKFSGRITGAFYAEIDPKTSTVSKPKLVPFTEEFLAQVDVDNFASVKGNNPGLYNGFRITHILNRDNGSVDLVSEYYRLVVSIVNDGRTMTTNYTYYYGDIVNTNISENGKAIFTRIPKNQIQVNSTLFVGFYPIVYKDKLVFLYNDDKDNVERDLAKKPDDVRNFKRSIFMATTVDAKGNLSRQQVYSHLEEDYITIPRTIRRITNSEYLVTSDLLKLFKRRIRFGVMQLK